MISRPSDETPDEPIGETASWMPLATVEHEAVYRRQRLIQHDMLALTLGAASLVVGTAILSSVAWLFLGELIGLCSFPALVVADFVIARRIDRRREHLLREIHDLDQAIRDGFGLGRGWLVDLTILQGAAPVGTDRGMLWFEEGRLMFAGNRTSFALASKQALRLRRAIPILGLQHGTNLELRATGPAGPLTLSLSPRDTSGYSGAPSREMAGTIAKHLRADIEDWIRTRPSPSSPGQLPPLVPGPGLASRDRVLAGAVLTSVYWIGVFMAVVRVPDWGVGLVVLFGASLIAITLRLLFPIRRWQAWNDLGKLDPALEER